MPDDRDLRWATIARAGLELDQHGSEEAVDPDEDFERLWSATIGLAAIMAEAAHSPTRQAMVGFSQIEGIYIQLSEAMLGYAWLRDEVVGAHRGDSLLERLETGLTEKDKKVLTGLFGTPALKAD
jgi:hypothetical protein